MRLLLVDLPPDVVTRFETAGRPGHVVDHAASVDAAKPLAGQGDPVDVVFVSSAVAEDAVRHFVASSRGPASPDPPEVIVVAPPAELRTIPDGVSDAFATPLGADELGLRLALVARRRAQRDQASRETVLATAVESTGDVVEITDASFTIEYVNPAFERTLGYSLEEAVGNTPRMLIRGSVQGPRFFQEIEDTLSSGRPWSGLIVSTDKQGRQVYLESTLSPLVGREGAVTHYVGVKRDVTERIRGEHELRRTNEELEKARDAALEASRAKSQFLANMSHELRTPLNAIIGYSEMLAEDGADVAGGEFVADLQKITSAAQHLLSLINDVLDFSKIEAGGMELFVEQFSGASLLRSVEETLGHMVDGQGNVLRVEAESDLGDLTQDVTKLRQTLINLVGNASKFTKGGEVIVRARRYEREGRDWVALAVTDTGIGMSEAQVQRLFLPFSQADASTTRRYGGTGLGLAICKVFCEMMGGSISVASEVGEGSTFTVEVPAELDTSMPRPSEPVPARTGRVLVIDDDPVARDLLERTLERRGFTVETAPDGPAGLEQAQANPPDVIVLDVLMPKMDGWNVIAELKRIEATRDIPVVMLTLMDQANLGYALGAADYVLKPIVPERVVEALMRHATPGGGTVLVVEDDAATRELVRRTLEKRGFSVEEAENGRVGLEAVERSLPTAVVLDLMMPEVDGFMFLEEMRRRGHHDVPVIVATAKELTAAERAQLESRVERILLKGETSREELLESLTRAVRTASRPRARRRASVAPPAG